MIDLSKEREAFEAKFPKSHWVEWDDKQGRYICAYVADAEANTYTKMFKAWIARAEKALQVMPTQRMLDAARDWSYKKYGKAIGNDAAMGCWKAMVEASESGAEG
ncbi:hypothetical protein [Acinetobacter sp. V115_6]|uniref:hypothetical protein n=1 Tax=Acinetobacter sp. V115_6 TaxID=3072987 RepID=UPI00287CCAA5|nr:hypothetical protein [Acinetobacter sp. V115_6]MDS7927636.1 hypothetical protein [Acinetobacter sp. V115_6]